MPWVGREVDPQACSSCPRPKPGSGVWRAVNEPTRAHPGRARAVHCATCGRHIGKRRLHVIAADARVVCVGCWERAGCPEAALASRAAAGRILAGEA